MNVRFFAGTRDQYNSLPVPRNPLGLYFCEDTKELFWADRLLTDGMRVVPTMADLPTPENAADGVVYYVTETRNGYVVPHGATEWLQTIYAPLRKGENVVPGEEDNTVTTVGAVDEIVKQIYRDMDERFANIEVGNTSSGVTAIYFAGKKLDSHDDGTFHIDRHCALRALGFVVPDDLSEDDKLDFVTKEYVDEQIAAATVADLSEYAKKTDLADFATESYVQEQIEAIPEIDLGEYAKKSEIPSIEGLATKAELDVIKLDMASLATEEYVEGKVASIEIPTKVSELDNDAGYLTEHQDLSEYAKKSELPVVEGLASEEFVIKKIAEAELADQDVDLSAYYTKSEVDALIPEVPTKVSELENDAGYITAADVPAADLSNYYNKTETESMIAEAVEAIEHPTVDLEGYATEEWVNEQGFLKEHQDLSEYAKKSDIPEAELFVVDYTAPDFAAAVEAYNNGKLLLLVNAAPDTNGYAVMNYVRDDMITFTKFLTSRSEAYGSFNTYYLHSDNTWEISKEVRLNKVEANVADEPTTELTSLRVGKEVYKLPDLANYVTNETLEQNYITQEEIANTYVTEEHISNTYVTVQQAEDTYVTLEALESADYITTDEAEIQIEQLVTEIVKEAVTPNAINYDTF